jgi:hypothetical protein
VSRPFDPPMFGEAIFSTPNRQYRYLLWRCWEPSLPQLTFVLCNPSTAGGLVNGHLDNDDTVNRLVEIAIANGAGGFTLANVVAHIEPKSASLRSEGLEGPENQVHLRAALRLSNKVVVGWGCSQLIRSRATRLLRSVAGQELWCVGTNSVSRTPMHPLQRGPKRTQLVRFTRSK